MEEIKCIFCHIESHQTIIRENGYTGKKCSECGLIFISPRPTSSEIINLYGHDQAFVTAESHITDEVIKRLYARHNLSILKAHIRDGALLEIGAGAGFFLDEARKQGFEVAGIELNQTQANFIKDVLKIPCEIEPLNEHSFPGKKFDIVYFCDVLSHFYDPFVEFRKIHTKLNDGGICIFETGNFADVEQKYLDKIEYFQYPDHLFFFGEQTLIRLLELTGFKRLKMYTYSILVERLLDKVYKESLRTLAHRLKRVIKGQRGAANNMSGPPVTSSALPSLDNGRNFRGKLRQLIRQVNIYLVYFGRYKAGAIAPKTGRPQTVIVVAKKVKL